MDFVILSGLIMHGIASNATPRTLSKGNRQKVMLGDMNKERGCLVQYVARTSKEIKPRIYFVMSRSNTVNLYMTYYFNVKVI